MQVFSSFFRLFPLIALLMATGLTACVERVHDHGYVKATAQFDKVVVGESTRENVYYTLGSPSTRSTFGDEIWYYINDTSESIAFLKPERVEQKVVAIAFNEEGVVDDMQEFTMEEAQEIAYSDEVTPTEGNKLTVWQQFLGNLGRFNPGTSQQAPGAGGGP